MEDNVITLSTGAEVEILKAPTMVLQEIQKQAQSGKPKVPKVWIEDKGREEENPNDPDYLDAMKDWLGQAGLKGIEVSLIFGTKIKSLPGNIPVLESNEWQDDLKYMGLGARFHIL